jgi:hypothetical protein
MRWGVGYEFLNVLFGIEVKVIAKLIKLKLICPFQPYFNIQEHFY